MPSYSATSVALLRITGTETRRQWRPNSCAYSSCTELLCTVIAVYDDKLRTRKCHHAYTGYTRYGNALFRRKLKCQFTEVPIHYCPNRFRSALAVDSSHVESLCNLGELLRCQDKTDEAESLLRHVIARFVLALCRRRCMQ